MVTLEIKSCGKCPFIDHSGAFTPGGAKAICGHHNAVDRVGQFKRVSYKQRYHWRYRKVSRDGAIVAWCPLRGE